MNFRLLARLLSMVAMLIGATMVFSLPWALPQQYRASWQTSSDFESRGFGALLGSLVVSFIVGGLLYYAGRNAKGRLFRREAMAVVGLSWVLATLLGALPYLFAGVMRDSQVPMTVADALFESQSGFSTTGATVLSQLEDPELVPHCILFWRSSTHFLGGLGIIVLFVVVLGQGSAGKALMRAEMPGPTKEGATARMQHTAWLFAAIYCGLNIVLAILLKFQGLTWFDALCHAFGTMATGGFSTYNASLGAFQSAAIDYIVIFFMLLAGTNFTLLYLLFQGRPLPLLKDVEWQTYLGVILGVTVLVVAVELRQETFASLADAIRYGLFQVVSVITTTGYGTHDFDLWGHFSRGLLLLLMFVGGCAGSTGGGMKVIRHILFFKILSLEIEESYHPTVVRPLRLGGRPVDDASLRRNILVYFSLILAIFMVSWVIVVAFEPDDTWGSSSDHKLLDSASAVAATLNNIGPGLGTVGATRNYGHFTDLSKTLFVVLMMLGRLEIFSILVLLSPRFWRTA